jgi:hypothetical protein
MLQSGFLADKVKQLAVEIHFKADDSLEDYQKRVGILQDLESMDHSDSGAGRFVRFSSRHNPGLKRSINILGNKDDFVGFVEQYRIQIPQFEFRPNINYVTSQLLVPSIKIATFPFNTYDIVRISCYTFYKLRINYQISRHSVISQDEPVQELKSAIKNLKLFHH